MNEQERLQFTKDLIAALEFAQNASQQIKSPAVLAKDAYNKLQFDFPLVTVEELDALTTQYQQQSATNTGDLKLTNKYIDVVYEGSAPTVVGDDTGDDTIKNNSNITTSSSSSSTGDPLRAAYQRLYAASLLNTVKNAIKNEKQCVNLLDKLHLQMEPNFGLLDDDGDDVQNEAVGVKESMSNAATTRTTTDSWTSTVLPKLNFISTRLKFQCMDEVITWQSLKLAQLITDCLATCRESEHFSQLEVVNQTLCSLIHDHIVAQPSNNLDTLDGLLKALDIGSKTSTSSSSGEKMNEQGAIAARLSLQVVASLASRITAPSAKRRLWQVTNDALLPTASSLMEMHEAIQRAKLRSKKKTGDVENNDDDTQDQNQLNEMLQDVALLSKLVSFYVLAAPATIKIDDSLLKTGLYRSLVLIFVSHGLRNGMEPLHHALRLCCASAPSVLVPWAEAVPGFKEAMQHEEFGSQGLRRLHGAVWSAVKGNDEALAVILSEPVTVDTVPDVYRVLSMLSEVHAAARTNVPWGSATNIALKDLGLRLRQGFAAEENTTKTEVTPATSTVTITDVTTIDAPTKPQADQEEEITNIVELLDEIDVQDARKLQVSAQEQAEVLIARRARQLQPECLRILKGLLQAPGVSGKGD